MVTVSCPSPTCGRPERPRWLGLLAKGATQPYRAGRRDWIKVKQRSAVDVVCAAVLGPVGRPEAVAAGLPIDGELHIVGRTVPLYALASRALAGEIRSHTEGTHPWPEMVTSAAVSGLGGSRAPITLTRIEPIVVEVSADVAWSGRSFRHPLPYVRVRPDLPPGGGLGALCYRLSAVAWSGTPAPSRRLERSRGRRSDASARDQLI